MEEAVAESMLGVVATAVSMVVEENDRTKSGNAILTLAISWEEKEKKKEETLQETVDVLPRLEALGMQFTDAKLEDIRQRLRGKMEIQRHFPTGLSAVLGVELASKLKLFCPKLREWRKDESSCVDLPEFITSSDTSDQKSTQEFITSGDTPTQKPRPESGSALGSESGNEHSWMVWAIAGASLGGAVATGLTIIVALVRRKR